MQSVLWNLTLKFFITISSARAQNLFYDESNPDLLDLTPPSLFGDERLDLNSPNVGPLDETTPNLLDNVV